MILLLLAYQEWKKPHLLLSCPAGSPTWALKNSTPYTKASDPFIIFWLQTSIPSSIFKLHSAWWAVIDVCIKFKSPVVFAQLGLMGNFLLQHPQKTKKQTTREANNRYSYSFGGQEVSLHRVCRVRSPKEVWHSHLHCPPRKWFFSMIQNSVSYSACKGIGRLVLVAARSSWNWVLHKVLRYVQTSLGIRSKKETGISGLFRI